MLRSLRLLLLGSRVRDERRLWPDKLRWPYGWSSGRDIGSMAHASSHGVACFLGREDDNLQATVIDLASTLDRGVEALCDDPVGSHTAFGLTLTGPLSSTLDRAFAV